LITFCNLGTFGTSRNSKESSKTYEILMLLVLASFTVPLTITTMLFVLNIDPFSFIFPHFDHFFLNLISFLLRFISNLLTSHAIWLPIGCLFLFFVLTVNIVSDTTGFMKKWTDVRLNHDPQFHYQKRAIIKRNNKTVPEPSKRRNVTIGSIIMIQQQIRIVIELFNESCYYLLPSLLLFGQIMLILGNYATIKMQDTIPMPFYLIMPSVSLIVVVNVAVLFPAASDVYEGSLEFLRSVDLIVGRSKYWRKVWRAERPLRFNFGGYFLAKRSTKTTFFYQCIDFTVTALMLF
jgi:hypothetical protein